MSGTVVVNQVAVELYDGYGSSIVKNDGYSVGIAPSGIIALGKDRFDVAHVLRTNIDGYVQIEVMGSTPLAAGAASETTLSSLNIKTPSLGQAAMVASSPVVIASNQSAIPVSGTFFQATQPISGSITAIQPTGSNLHTVIDSGTITNLSQLAGTAISMNTGVRDAGTQRITIATNDVVGATQSGTWNITNLSGTVSLPTGASTASLQSTGNSSLSSIDGKTPSLGQAVMTSSVPVVIASNQGAISVSGTFFQATQPVSGTVAATQSGSWTTTVSQTTGANLHTIVDSGTITANIGTSGSLAVDATLTGGTQRSRITDGTTNAAVKTASTAAAAIDPALVVAISPNNIIPVSGTFFQATQPVSGSGSFTVSQPTAANLNATVVGTVSATQSGTWNITNISGSISLPTGAATEATLSARLAESTFTGRINTLGQKTSAASTPVVLASDQSVITVSGNFFQATQPVSGSGNFNVVGASSDNSTNSALKIPVISALATASPPTWTTGNMVPLSTDTSGALRITGAISASNPSVSTTATTPPSSATYVGASVSTTAPTYTTGQINALSLTTGGALRVDSSSTTQPISGTITANAGSGNFTVVQSTAANLNATVSGTVAATQNGTWNINNITGTVSLPTGAATEATLATRLSDSTFIGRINTQGQKTSSGSTPVVIASDQSAIAVSGAFFQATQPISGTITANQGGTWTIQPGNTPNTNPWLSSIAQGGTVATVVTADPTANAAGLTVRIAGEGFVSTVNSTSVNLGIGGIFTGASEDVSQYQSIKIQVFSSAASAVDGLSLQQSVDGVNWDRLDIYSIPAATGKEFIMDVGAQFYRVVYTNGGAATSSLRIQTLYHKSASRGSSVRPQDGRTNDNDMSEVASYMSGFNGTSWDRLRSSTSAPVGNEPALLTRNILSGMNTATLSNVAGTTTSVQFLAANTARTLVIFYNDSTSAAFIKFGTTASSTSFTYKVAAGGTLELPDPIYRGRIDGVWVSAAGNMRITEITP